MEEIDQLKNIITLMIKQYYEISYGVNLAIYKRFKEENITIPYPQRDVHLIDHRQF